MSELFHDLEPSFDRGPQSLKATPPTAIMPSVLTSHYPSVKIGLAQALWSYDMYQHVHTGLFNTLYHPYGVAMNKEGDCLGNFSTFFLFEESPQAYCDKYYLASISCFYNQSKK